MRITIDELFEDSEDDVSIVPPVPMSIASTEQLVFDGAAVIELWQERAAIMSIDGELSVEEAEEMAWADVWSQAEQRQGAPTLVCLMPVGAKCFRCDCRHQIDTPNVGLECLNCGVLAWVAIGSSLVRGDCLEKFQ
jgi:hypothetical protein